jgi:lipoprotein signal peptidase
VNRTDWVFGFTCLLILLQLVSLYFRLRHRKPVFYLVTIGSIFFGGVGYLFYGFPLDEGTIAEIDVPVFERNFAASAVLLLSSLFSLVIVLLKRLDRR